MNALSFRFLYQISKHFRLVLIRVAVSSTGSSNFSSSVFVSSSTGSSAISSTGVSALTASGKAASKSAVNASSLLWIAALISSFAFAPTCQRSLREYGFCQLSILN